MQTSLALLLRKLEAFVANHLRLLTVSFGAATVCVWTVLRHITNGVNFDVVGQIGLADQWARGMHSGAQLGVTNYVLKLPLYFLINTLSFISPMNRLLLLALICNILTFILLFALFEKIMNLYNVRDKTWLYLGMLWLASMTGSVFWADYANSRNLETVGGILFLYLVLKYLKRNRAVTASLILLTGSVVFFADSLEFYVIGLGVCAYVSMRLLVRRTKKEALLFASIVGLTTISIVGAKVLGLLLKHILKLSYLSVPHQKIGFDSSSFSTTVHGLLTSTLDIFGADFIKRPFTVNTVREVIGFVTLCAVFYLIVRNWNRIRTKSVLFAALIIIGVNYLVYIASGQVLVWATSRYLILVPLLVILMLAVSGDAILNKQARKMKYSLLLLTLLSMMMLCGALVTHWSDRHVKDQHIYTTKSFLHDNGYHYALSSREVGVTTTYFAQGKSIVLPLLCGSDHRLVPTDLFYDRAPFERLQSQHEPIPIIVPSGGITAGSLSCSTTDVTAQFGAAEEQFTIPGVGEVLVYSPARLNVVLPHSFSE